jgi:hypothetical protein
MAEKTSSAKPRVRLLTAYNNAFAPIAVLTLPRMKALADANGYEFRAVTREDCERPAGWIKIEPILDALAADFDFVFWLDADAVVLRSDMDVRTAVSGAKDLYMCWHEPRAFPAHFNTGVMLIRTSEWSRAFFSEVWERGPVTDVFRDQGTILHQLGYNEAIGLGSDRHDHPARDHIGLLDSAWNTIPGTAGVPDPIIHHYAAGVPVQVRCPLIAADCSTLEVREPAPAEIRAACSTLLSRWWTDVTDAYAQAQVTRAELDGAQQQLAAEIRLRREVEQLYARTAEHLEAVLASPWRHTRLLRLIKTLAKRFHRFASAATSR